MNNNNKNTKKYVHNMSQVTRPLLNDFDKIWEVVKYSINNEWIY